MSALSFPLVPGLHCVAFAADTLYANLARFGSQRSRSYNQAQTTCAINDGRTTK